MGSPYVLCGSQGKTLSPPLNSFLPSQWSNFYPQIVSNPQFFQISSPPPLKLQNGHTEIVDWAQENGCPWGSLLHSECIWNEALEVAKTISRKLQEDLRKENEQTLLGFLSILTSYWKDLADVLEVAKAELPKDLEDWPWQKRAYYQPLLLTLNLEAELERDELMIQLSRDLQVYVGETFRTALAKVRALIQAEMVASSTNPVFEFKPDQAE